MTFHRSPARRLYALLLVMLWIAPAAIAGEVNDAGHFFSPDAVQKLQQQIQQIKQKTAKDVAIVTYPAIPADRQPAYDASRKEQFYNSWVEELGKSLHTDILFLIVRNPAHFQIGMNQATRGTQFTRGDRDELVQSILGPAFREHHFDQGMTQALDFVEQRLQTHGTAAGATGSASQGQTAAPTRRRTVPPATPRGTGAGGWTGLICLIVGGIGILMLIGSLFRRRSYGPGPGYGGPGYPPQAGGYGPGYPPQAGGYGGGYGGGGGWGRGFLGGLFGGMLGGYAADRMFGQHNAPGGSFPPGNAPGDASGADFGSPAGPPDDTGPASSGFDFGPSDSSSGADFGSSDPGGGSDFGGGGGGDFSSGGGDFGGGDSGGGGDF